MKKILIFFMLLFSINIFAKINYDNYLGYWENDEWALVISKENNQYFYKLYVMDFDYNKTKLEYASDAAYMTIFQNDEFRVKEYPKEKLKLLENGIEITTKDSKYRLRSGLEFKDPDKSIYIDDLSRYLANFENGERYPGMDVFRMTNSSKKSLKKIKKIKVNR